MQCVLQTLRYPILNPILGLVGLDHRLLILQPLFERLLVQNSSRPPDD